MNVLTPQPAVSCSFYSDSTPFFLHLWSFAVRQLVRTAFAIGDCQRDDIRGRCLIPVTHHCRPHIHAELLQVQCVLERSVQHHCTWIKRRVHVHSIQPASADVTASQLSKNRGAAYSGLRHVNKWPTELNLKRARQSSGVRGS